MEKMTEREITERRLIKMAYRKGREELAKMLIQRFDPDRPPTSEDAYYYKDEILEIIKEMAGVDDGRHDVISRNMGRI